MKSAFKRIWKCLTDCFRKEEQKIESVGEQEQIRELVDRILTLEEELNKRDQLIAQMRREYESLTNKFNQEKMRFHEEALEKYISQIINRLAMLVTLACGIKANLKVEIEDIANQILFLEKELISTGLEPIGRPGEIVKFDASLHQPMGVGLISDGADVLIKIQGYKLRGKVLVKSIVAGVEG